MCFGKGFREHETSEWAGVRGHQEAQGHRIDLTIQGDPGQETLPGEGPGPRTPGTKLIVQRKTPACRAHQGLLGGCRCPGVGLHDLKVGPVVFRFVPGQGLRKGATGSRPDLPFREDPTECRATTGVHPPPDPNPSPTLRHVRDPISPRETDAPHSTRGYRSSGGRPGRGSKRRRRPSGDVVIGIVPDFRPESPGPRSLRPAPSGNPGPQARWFRRVLPIQRPEGAARRIHADYEICGIRLWADDE